MSKDGNYNVNHGLMVFFNHIHLSLCWRIVQSCLVTERSQNDSTDAFQANITACVTVIKKKIKSVSNIYLVYYTVEGIYFCL